MLEDKKPQLTPISELGEFGLIKTPYPKISLLRIHLPNVLLVMTQQSSILREKSSDYV